MVSPDHPIHASSPWTQQSQGCGRPGDFIYLPRSFVRLGGSSDDGSSGEREAIRADNGNQSEKATAAVDEKEQDSERQKWLGDEIR